MLYVFYVHVSLASLYDLKIKLIQTCPGRMMKSHTWVVGHHKLEYLWDITWVVLYHVREAYVYDIFYVHVSLDSTSE